MAGPHKSLETRLVKCKYIVDLLNEELLQSPVPRPHGRTAQEPGNKAIVKNLLEQVLLLLIHVPVLLSLQLLLYKLSGISLGKKR